MHYTTFLLTYWNDAPACESTHSMWENKQEVDM